MDGPEVVTRRVRPGVTNLLGRGGTFRTRHTSGGFLRGPRVERWDEQRCEVVGFDDGKLLLRLDDGHLETWYPGISGEGYGEDLILDPPDA